MTLLIGISLGANVVIAQYLGAGKQDKVEETVQTAIVMALGWGAAGGGGELIASPALKLLAVLRKSMTWRPPICGSSFWGCPF